MAAHEHEAGIEVLNNFTDQARVDPREPGEEHSDIPGLWVAQPPALIRRLPLLVIVYTIDDDGGFVDMCNLYRF